MSKKLQIARPELHPIPVKSPWHHIGVDFVGPISPESAQGNRYILTMCDYFTKFAWAKPLPSKEASRVAQSLKEVSTIDQSNFTGRIMHIILLLVIDYVDYYIIYHRFFTSWGYQKWLQQTKAQNSKTN